MYKKKITMEECEAIKRNRLNISSIHTSLWLFHNKMPTLIFQENHINNPFSLHLTYYHVDTIFYRPNNTKLALNNVLGKDSGTQHTRVLAPWVVVWWMCFISRIILTDFSLSFARVFRF